MDPREPMKCRSCQKDPTGDCGGHTNIVEDPREPERMTEEEVRNAVDNLIRVKEIHPGDGSRWEVRVGNTTVNHGPLWRKEECCAMRDRLRYEVMQGLAELLATIDSARTALAKAEGERDAARVDTIREVVVEIRKRCRHWGRGRGACDACTWALIIGAMKKAGSGVGKKGESNPQLDPTGNAGDSRPEAVTSGHSEELVAVLREADYAISAFSDGHDHCVVCAKNIERALKSLRSVGKYHEVKVKEAP